MLNWWRRSGTETPELTKARDRVRRKADRIQKQNPGTTRLQALYQIRDEMGGGYANAMPGVLYRGDTGFEIRTADGVVIHVCHSDEIEHVIEFLETEFPNEFKLWRQRDADRR